MDSKYLRRVLGAYATGITVVTVGGGTPHAMTANSFTSVSLDPPLVLICVGRDAIMHESLGHSRFFGISVLAAHQEQVARHFADRTRPLGWAQFDSVDWAAGHTTGVPLIVGSLAHLECEVWQRYDGGDHTIFVGRLLSLDRPGDHDALLFVDGRYRQLQALASEVRT